MHPQRGHAPTPRRPQSAGGPPRAHDFEAFRSARERFFQHLRDQSTITRLEIALRSDGPVNHDPSRGGGPD